MLQAHASASTDELYLQISLAPESSSTLESELTESDAVSNLKKAQKALLKAIERRQGDVNLAEREEVETAGSPEPLPYHEVEALVQVIKREDNEETVKCKDTVRRIRMMNCLSVLYIIQITLEFIAE